jgi:hypothetical protein
LNKKIRLSRAVAVVRINVYHRVRQQYFLAFPLDFTAFRGAGHILDNNTFQQKK